MTIGGFIFLHNGVASDYCFEHAIESLAFACDRVIAADCESTDGTLQRLREIQKRFPHVEIVSLPWTPSPWGRWLRDLGNTLRSQLGTDWWFHLQWDEVIDPAEAPLVRSLIRHSANSFQFERFNFWASPHLITPTGRVCGNHVVRLARIDIPLAGDCEGAMPTSTTVKTSVPIWHYGFMRNPESFRRKGILMETAYTSGSYNPVLDTLPEKGIKGLQDCWPVSEALPFTRPHPQFMHKWITDRGHKL